MTDHPITAELAAELLTAAEETPHAGPASPARGNLRSVPRGREGNWFHVAPMALGQLRWLYRLLRREGVAARPRPRRPVVDDVRRPHRPARVHRLQRPPAEVTPCSS